GGFVYLSPDGQSAVKVHRHRQGFSTELRAYQRLRLLRINQLHGLTIPKLKDHSVDLRIIRMDCVIAPFLLDFAGVLFSPPDYSEDTMNDWHARLDEMFGPNVHIAYAVYNSLARHAMYYMDFRPSNMKLDGLPGLQPMDSEPDDF